MVRPPNSWVTKPEYTVEEKTWFSELGYAGYWLSFDPETHARHARLLRDAEQRKAPLTIDTQPLPARAVTSVTARRSSMRASTR